MKYSVGSVMMIESAQSFYFLDLGFNASQAIRPRQELFTDRHDVSDPNLLVISSSYK